MPETLWDRVKYRRKFVGKVTRDGTVYKKYMKVRRFRGSHLRVVLYICLALLAAKFVARFMSRLDSAPAAEQAPVIEAQ